MALQYPKLCDLSSFQDAVSIDQYSCPRHNKCMKLYAVVVILNMLLGCSHNERKTIPPEAEIKILPKEVTSDRFRSQGVALELFSPEQLTLHFKNIETLVQLSVIVPEGVSLQQFAPGHWELTAVESRGLSYNSINISRKFVLNVKPGFINYGGSFILGCPNLESGDLKLLKKMKFFNRYPFGASSGLCEVVIGNNFASVKKELMKMIKSQKLRIHMGL
jgi:hypothetical protein